MLAISPCQTLCDWAPTEASYQGEALFRCAGCGSEWVRAQAWTPRQADGTIPAAVLRELKQP